RQERKVTLVTESAGTAEAAYFFNIIRVAALQFFMDQEKERLKVITSAKIKEITSDGVRIEAEGAEQFLNADTVVACFDREPVTNLYDALRNKVPEIYKIGDCVKAGAVWNSIDDANYVARKI
ncbi:MAG: hypothetical protein ACFFB3_04195, partial [Candidatus Hodarchaeota archaeon]